MCIYSRDMLSLSGNFSSDSNSWSILRHSDDFALECISQLSDLINWTVLANRRLSIWLRFRSVRILLLQKLLYDVISNFVKVNIFFIFWIEWIIWVFILILSLDLSSGLSLIHEMFKVTPSSIFIMHLLSPLIPIIHELRNNSFSNYSVNLICNLSSYFVNLSSNFKKEVLNFIREQTVLNFFSCVRNEVFKY